MSNQRPDSICCTAQGTATSAPFQEAFQRLMFSVAHETSVHVIDKQIKPWWHVEFYSGQEPRLGKSRLNEV